ncbi:hypothetical protein JOS77_26880 [Chromobacterium haemolyticum]|nr:hypothetical protein JOS77_26880 [Chromobacterium haemolyticum]
MQQNIYDHPVFFSQYQALRDNDSGLNGALEQPALRDALPPLSGADVLDLGCGFGDFARWGARPRRGQRHRGGFVRTHAGAGASAHSGFRHSIPVRRHRGLSAACGRL